MKDLLDRPLLTLGLGLGIAMIAAFVVGASGAKLIAIGMMVGALAQALCSALLLHLFARRRETDVFADDWPSLEDVNAYEYESPHRAAPPPAPGIIGKIDAVEREVAARHGNEWPFPVRAPQAEPTYQSVLDGFQRSIRAADQELNQSVMRSFDQPPKVISGITDPRPSSWPFRQGRGASEPLTDGFDWRPSRDAS